MSLRLDLDDVRYAAMSDAQIEALWRSAPEGAARVPLVRQLVLRALDVIEASCRVAGEARAFSPAEIERAVDEAVARLFARLYANTRVASIRALARALASEVVADEGRPRMTQELRLATHRRLRLVGGSVKR